MCTNNLDYIHAENNIGVMYTHIYMCYASRYMIIQEDDSVL